MKSSLGGANSNVGAANSGILGVGSTSRSLSNCSKKAAMCSERALKQTLGGLVLGRTAAPCLLDSLTSLHAPATPPPGNSCTAATFVILMSPAPSLPYVRYELAHCPLDTAAWAAGTCLEGGQLRGQLGQGELAELAGVRLRHLNTGDTQLPVCKAAPSVGMGAKASQTASMASVVVAGSKEPAHRGHRGSKPMRHLQVA